MYKKTIDLDDIHIFRYKKTCGYKKQNNKAYEDKLHQRRLELLALELKKGI